MVKILLADDEEAIIAELAPFLERSGYEVAVARDGDEAMKSSKHARRSKRQLRRPGQVRPIQRDEEQIACFIHRHQVPPARAP